MTPINKNHGVVRRISPDKSRIWIRLPRGGVVEAQNEGLEVGDVVCFVVGPSGNIVKVMPKYAADLIVEIANNPLLKSALQNKEVSNEHNPGAVEFEQDCPDCRPSASECADLYGGEDRGYAEERSSEPEHEFYIDYAPWVEG